MSNKLSAIVIEIISTLLIFLFVYTATSKLTWKEHLLFNIGVSIPALSGFMLSKRSKNFIAINRPSRKPV